MNIVAYFFIVSAVVFVGAMFGVRRERDGDGAYAVMGLACLTMLITGFGLALHVLGVNPRITF